MFVCFPLWGFGVFICQLLVVSESTEISNIIILNLELNQGFLNTVEKYFCPLNTRGDAVLDIDPSWQLKGEKAERSCSGSLCWLFCWLHSSPEQSAQTMDRWHEYPQLAFLFIVFFILIIQPRLQGTNFLDS